MAYDLRTYSKDEWFKLLDRSAVSITAVCDEQGEETPPVAQGLFVFILKRRGNQAMVVAGGSKGSIRAGEERRPENCSLISAIESPANFSQNARTTSNATTFSITTLAADTARIPLARSLTSPIVSCSGPRSACHAAESRWASSPRARPPARHSSCRPRCPRRCWYRA